MAKWRIIAVIIGLFVVIFGVALLWKRCNPPPKLDEKAIQKAQDAIAKQDRKEMIEILAKSDTKEAEIDANVDQIEAAREDAKQNYTGLSNDELAAELEKRAKE